MKFARYIPNALTITRMLLAVPLGLWLWQEKVYAALGLLIFAGITDLLDGYLAREFNWRTPSGAWLDPTADKILVTTSLITLTCKGWLPLWFALVVLARDLGLILGVASLLIRRKRIEIQPLLTGKLAVTMQNVVLLTAILLPLFSWVGQLLPVLLVLSTVVTVVSAVAYGKTLAGYK